MNEDWLDGVGELNEVAAGTVGTLPLTLAPGRYVFFCNMDGHYLGGMHAVLEVTAHAWGAAGRRLLAPGPLHLVGGSGDLAVYRLVIRSCGYNAPAIADQRGSALVVNVAARQRASPGPGTRRT